MISQNVRIVLILADGLDAKLIYLSGGWRRKYHAIFQSREKFKPEWEYADVPLTASSASVGSNRSSLYSNRFGIFSLFSLFSDTTLTAVSGHKLTAPGKTVDGQAALGWIAFFAIELQMIDLVDGETGSRRSSHDTGVPGGLLHPAIF